MAVIARALRDMEMRFPVPIRQRFDCGRGTIAAVHRKTAKAIGVVIPQSLLLRADRVID
jgi:hypothetical protein